jgi:hypothetical protein
MGPVDGAGTYATTGGSSIAHVHFRVGTLGVANGATAVVSPDGTNTGTSRVGTLSINTAQNAKLNLNDNDLIATATPVATVRSLIASGRTPTAAWNGPGINSAVAAAASPRNKALGLLSGSEYISVAGNNFNGFTVAPGDAVVKFTWCGDTDFNGRINFDDYVRTDNGFNNHLSGWLNGDFNYDGLVNFDDYVLIDLAFNTQSGTLGHALAFLGGGGSAGPGHSSDGAAGMGDVALRMVRDHYEEFGSGYAQHFLAAVPEPTVLACTSLGLLLAARRRRLQAGC